MHHGMRFLALGTIVICLLLSGCGSRDTEASSDEAALRAKAIAAHYGPTTAFTADMRAAAKPVEGDLLSFSVSLRDAAMVACASAGKNSTSTLSKASSKQTTPSPPYWFAIRRWLPTSLSDIASAVAKGVAAAGGAAFSESRHHFQRCSKLPPRHRQQLAFC